jgi:hypothetical protein
VTTSSPQSPNQLNTPEVPGSGAFRFRESFEATTADRAALDESALIAVNADPSSAMHIVLAAWPRIASLLDEIAKLPVEHRLIARCKLYAWALGHAHSLYVIATTPPEELEARYQEGLKRRAALRSDVQNLIHHGLVPQDSLARVRNETGFRNVAADLGHLVNIMRNATARVEGRTATLPEDLAKAEMLAAQLVEIIAQREGSIAMTSSIAADRQRAFTLMARAYDEVRRAVRFLLWRNGEADKLVPSMYQVDNTPKKKPARASDEPQTPTLAPVPSVPTANRTHAGRARS